MVDKESRGKEERHREAEEDAIQAEVGDECKCVGSRQTHNDITHKGYPQHGHNI